MTLDGVQKSGNPLGWGLKIKAERVFVDEHGGPVTHSGNRWMKREEKGYGSA